MWPFKQDRTWDFEGRCTHPDCEKRSLDIILTVETDRKITLEVVPCIAHPKESHILWPQRDDIIRQE